MDIFVYVMISTAFQSQNAPYTKIYIVQPAKMLQTILAYLIKSVHKKRSQSLPKIT